GRAAAAASPAPAATPATNAPATMEAPAPAPAPAARRVPAAAAAPAGVPEAVLPVFYQWTGTHGQALNDRPFFLIRDLDTLTKFYARVRFESSLPHVDFDKRMIFVGFPGPTLFDFQPLRIAGFFRRRQRYTVLLDFDRRRTGGFWRNPFVVGLLPAIPAADVDVMKVGNPLKGEPTRVPLYTIWEMSRQRSLPLTPAQPWQAPQNRPPLPTYGFDLTPKPPTYDIILEAPKITVTSINRTARPIPRPVTIPTRTVAPEPPPVKTPPAGTTQPRPPDTQPKTPLGQPPVTVTTAATATAPAGGTASSGADPFGDAFNLDF
ncbi:MAG: hypothetical protein GX442_00970, partial [Candidatus Riflebacteria bacterium]|nr:hypothetical protein [Candidatus Riflebacteria bacterium]